MSPPDSDPIVVSVDRVRVSYGERAALNGLSLEIRSGEIYGLLGPNGAGKTTLVGAISGRIRPASGTVRVLGEDPAASRAARSRIGLVPQQIALYDNLTCAENLRAFGRLLGVGRRDADRRQREVLEAIGLSERSRELCCRLSGGMQRRLNIGAAILHDPALLVLDEPTVGVDLHAKRGIHDLLAGLRTQGMAILVTTHDMDQAAALADRVGIIAKGALVDEGSPADLVTRTFGDGREIIVTLEAPPQPAVRDVLKASGLQAVQGGAVWAGRTDGDYAAAQELEGHIRAAGGTPKEISIRQPSLTSVMLRSTGVEPTP